MGKTKTTSKGADAAKSSKELKKSAVKEGRVTKPAQTPKAKSKEIAKSAAANHAVRDVPQKKDKKTKKARTPEPESDSSESSDSDASDTDTSSSSSEEEKTVVKKAEGKTNGVAKVPAKADSDASTDTSSDESSDIDQDEPAVTPKASNAKPNGPAAKDAASTSSEEDDSSDDSESSSGDEEEAMPAKVNGSTKTKPTKKAEASSDSEADSDSDSDSDSGSDDSSPAESEEEEAPSKKRKAEAEPTPAVKKTKTDEDAEEGVKNLFVGNLSWNIDEEWLAREFGEHGEVVGCRIVTDRDSGRSRGFGYVEYATVAEAKAAQAAMHQSDLDGRALNVDFSAPRTKTENKPGDRAKRFGDTLGTPNNTLFIGNISFDATNDMVSEAFSEYGNLTRVSLPTDRETGAPKGFGYVDFSSVDEAKAALEALSGAEIAGRAIRLDYATPRDDNGGSRGRGGGGFGGRGRGGDRGRGGRGGGGFGGRGGGGRGRGRGGTTNRGGFGDFKGSKVTF